MNYEEPKMKKSLIVLGMLFPVICFFAALFTRIFASNDREKLAAKSLFVGVLWAIPLYGLILLLIVLILVS